MGYAKSGYARPGYMQSSLPLPAAPYVVSAALYGQEGGTWKYIPTPEHSIGDLLVIIFRSEEYKSTPTGWTKLTDKNSDGRTFIWYKVATQLLPPEIVAEGTVADNAAAITYVIRNYSLPLNFGVVTGAVLPELIGLTPAPKLSLALLTNRRTDSSVTAPPEGFYSSFTIKSYHINSQEVSAIRTSTAEKFIASDTLSINPGTFTTEGVIDSPHTGLIVITYQFYLAAVTHYLPYGRVCVIRGTDLGTEGVLEYSSLIDGPWTAQTVETWDTEEITFYPELAAGDYYWKVTATNGNGVLGPATIATSISVSSFPDTLTHNQIYNITGYAFGSTGILNYSTNIDGPWTAMPVETWSAENISFYPLIASGQYYFQIVTNMDTSVIGPVTVDTDLALLTTPDIQLRSYQDEQPKYTITGVNMESDGFLSYSTSSEGPWLELSTVSRTSDKITFFADKTITIGNVYWRVIRATDNQSIVTGPNTVTSVAYSAYPEVAAVQTIINNTDNLHPYPEHMAKGDILVAIVRTNNIIDWAMEKYWYEIDYDGDMVNSYGKTFVIAHLVDSNEGDSYSLPYEGDGGTTTKGSAVVYHIRQSALEVYVVRNDNYSTSTPPIVAPWPASNNLFLNSATHRRANSVLLTSPAGYSAPAIARSPNLYNLSDYLTVVSCYKQSSESYEPSNDFVFQSAVEYPQGLAAVIRGYSDADDLVYEPPNHELFTLKTKENIPEFVLGYPKYALRKKDLLIIVIRLTNGVAFSLPDGFTSLGSVTSDGTTKVGYCIIEGDEPDYRAINSQFADGLCLMYKITEYTGLPIASLVADTHILPTLSPTWLPSDTTYIGVITDNFLSANPATVVSGDPTAFTDTIRLSGASNLTYTPYVPIEDTFPTVKGSNSGEISIDESYVTVVFPLNVAAGDLIVLSVAIDDLTFSMGGLISTFIQPEGWTAIPNLSGLGVWYKVADGTETEQIISWDLAQQATWLVTLIDGTTWGGKIYGYYDANYNSSQVTPPTIVAPWAGAGVDHNLWLALYRWDSAASATTIMPVNYIEEANIKGTGTDSTSQVLYSIKTAGSEYKPNTLLLDSSLQSTVGHNIVINPSPNLPVHKEYLLMLARAGSGPLIQTDSSDGLVNPHAVHIAVQSSYEATVVTVEPITNVLNKELTSITGTNFTNSGELQVSPKTGLIQPVTLTWADSYTNYQLEVAEDSLFSITVVSETLLTNTYELPILNEGQTYYWRVRGY